MGKSFFTFIFLFISFASFAARVGVLQQDEPYCVGDGAIGSGPITCEPIQIDHPQHGLITCDDCQVVCYTSYPYSTDDDSHYIDGRISNCRIEAMALR